MARRVIWIWITSGKDDLTFEEVIHEMIRET